MPDSALGTGTQMWPLPSQGFLSSIQGTWFVLLPLQPSYIARQPWWTFSLVFVESTSYVLDVTSFDFHHTWKGYCKKYSYRYCKKEYLT